VKALSLHHLISDFAIARIDILQHLPPPSYKRTSSLLHLRCVPSTLSQKPILDSAAILLLPSHVTSSSRSMPPPLPTPHLHRPAQMCLWAHILPHCLPTNPVVDQPPISGHHPVDLPSPATSTSYGRRWNGTWRPKSPTPWSRISHGRVPVPDCLRPSSFDLSPSSLAQHHPPHQVNPIVHPLKIWLYYAM
jgi:hypothetical protein